MIFCVEVHPPWEHFPFRMRLTTRTHLFLGPSVSLTLPYQSVSLAFQPPPTDQRTNGATDQRTNGPRA